MHMERSGRLARTPIGDCTLNRSGHLLPCDAHHAPVQHYRSYGEWFEAGRPRVQTPGGAAVRAGQFWPYGHGVAKIQPTDDVSDRYMLGDTPIDKAKLTYSPAFQYALPPLNRALPHMAATANQREASGSVLAQSRRPSAGSQSARGDAGASLAPPGTGLQSARGTQRGPLMPTGGG
mmetsp:Transcript_163072/g.522921  ORF Transcript_163072/g.522921 Transcript_163072/m.522921 type:complete len:177 (+) Transcript_163072:86-616(+)